VTQRIFRVTDAPYSARGDGRADDTAAIQRAVDAARRAGGGTVLFPRGTYMVTTVHVSHGMTLQGESGAVLRRPARPARASGPAEARIVEARKWMRMLSTERDAWDGAGDSPPLVVRGLTLDGNRTAQGAHGRYELQQAHLLFLTARTRRPGRLRAVVQNCHFRDSPGDGVSVFTNCSVRVTDCTAADCFRGAVVVTGGHSVVQIQRVRSTGAGLPTGIDVEVDGRGYGGSMVVEVTAEDLDLDGGFDVNAPPGSVFRGARITSRYPFLFVAAQGATVEVRDSSFTVGELSDQVNRIVWPHRVTFTRCAFHVSEAAGRGEANRTFAALHVFFNISGTNERHQRLRLVDCNFAVHPSIEAGDTVYAVYTQHDHPGQDNVIAIQGGNIGSGFDQRFHLGSGGTLVVDGVERRAQADAPAAPGPFRGISRLVESADAAPVTVDEAHLAAALASPALRGLPGWVIVGDRPPERRTVPGRVGDRYRLRDGRAAWECTHGDRVAATWRRIRQDYA
jgi:hypothetical protein